MRLHHLIIIVLLVGALLGTLLRPGNMAIYRRAPAVLYGTFRELLIDGPKREEDQRWNRELFERRQAKWQAHNGGR